MSNLNKMLRILTEMPFVGPEEKMESKRLSEISEMQLKRAWTLFETFDDGLLVYKSKSGNSFVSGYLKNHKFKMYVDVNVSLPTKHAPKLKNSLQVNMVNSSDDIQEKGYAKRTYLSIIKKYTLISDTEQYQASKSLWKSIAREPDVFVYIWNDSEGSFIEEKGKPKRYDGINIIENEIFGSEDKHYKIVLIATSKEM